MTEKRTVKTETLELTTFERMELRQWMNLQRLPGLVAMRTGLAVVGKLELSDEEKTEVLWRDLGDGTATWADTLRTFEVEFTKTELRALKPALQAPWPPTEWYIQMLEKLEEVV